MLCVFLCHSFKYETLRLKVSKQSTLSLTGSTTWPPCSSPNCQAERRIPSSFHKEQECPISALFVLFVCHMSLHVCETLSTRSEKDSSTHCTPAQNKSTGLSILADTFRPIVLVRVWIFTTALSLCGHAGRGWKTKGSSGGKTLTQIWNNVWGERKRCPSTEKPLRPAGGPN